MFPSLKGFDLAADLLLRRVLTAGWQWFPSLKGFDLAADDQNTDTMLDDVHVSIPQRVRPRS